jgi:multidrug transporter EmrE-like cation transporter
MRTAVGLVVLVLAGSGADLCVAETMKRIGEVKDFSPAAILRVMRQAFCEGWMWLGIVLAALAFASLLALLSWEAVSFVIPATALSYVADALAGKYLLGERLTRLRWAGIGLVSVGVLLVCMG